MNEKKIGVWIDHRKAVLVSLNGKNEGIREVHANADRQLSRDHNVLSTEHYEAQLVMDDGRQERKYSGHLADFYQEVQSILKEYDSILIFGPGESKNELKRLMEEVHSPEMDLVVETEDKMTNLQISAKIHEFFKAQPARGR